MRTTTKEFKNKVQQHIIDRLGNPWDYENDHENENATTAEKLQNVVKEFKNWYCPFEQRRTPNRCEAFKSFLQGLPSCLNAEFTYYNQRESLREWHEQTEAEAERYNDLQIEAAYYHLIFREFTTLCKKYQVEF